MWDVSQLPPDGLVLSITSMVDQLEFWTSDSTTLFHTVTHWTAVNPNQPCLAASSLQMQDCMHLSCSNIGCSVFKVHHAVWWCFYLACYACKQTDRGICADRQQHLRLCSVTASGKRPHENISAGSLQQAGWLLLEFLLQRLSRSVLYNTS